MTHEHHPPVRGLPTGSDRTLPTVRCRNSTGSVSLMESMLDAVHRLRTAGFLHDLVAGPDSSYICSCGQYVQAEAASVLHTVRFGGTANPERQVILLAVATPCRHAALFRSAYGPAVETDFPDTRCEPF